MSFLVGYLLHFLIFSLTILGLIYLFINLKFNTEVDFKVSFRDNGFYFYTFYMYQGNIYNVISRNFDLDKINYDEITNFETFKNKIKINYRGSYIAFTIGSLTRNEIEI